MHLFFFSFFPCVSKCTITWFCCHCCCCFNYKYSCFYAGVVLLTVVGSLVGWLVVWLVSGLSVWMFGGSLLSDSRPNHYDRFRIVHYDIGWHNWFYFYFISLFISFFFPLIQQYKINDCVLCVHNGKKKVLISSNTFVVVVFCCFILFVFVFVCFFGIKWKGHWTRDVTICVWVWKCFAWLVMWYNIHAFSVIIKELQVELVFFCCYGV